MKVGDDGTVSLREGERVNVEYIVSNHFVGETIEIKLLRNGKVCLSLYSHHSFLTLSFPTLYTLNILLFSPCIFRIYYTSDIVYFI